MVVSDIVLESIRLIILLIIIIHLWNVGKNRKELLGHGWNLFFTGFLLLLFGNALDITDNFESLNRFVIIGDTEIEAFLEKMVGFLGGFLLIAIGLIRWIPAITSVDQLQKEIDKHEKTGQMLKKERNLAQNYLDIAKVIIVAIDSDQRVTLINKNGSEVLGYSKKDIIGRNWFDTFIPEESRHETKSVYEKILAGDIESVEHFENTILTKNGNKKVIRWNNAILKNEDGNIIGTLSSGEDITKRKKAEVELRESEQKYSNLVEKGNDGIIVIQDYIVYFANSKFGEITGYTKEESIGIPLLDLVSEDYKELVMDRYERRIKNDQTIPHRHELDFLSKDGKNIPVELNASYIEYDGKPAVMAIIRDITERKQIETALQKSEQKFRTLFNNSNDGIYLLDMKSNILEVNQKACERLGYSRDELLQMTPRDFTNEEDISKVPELNEQLWLKGNVLFETIHFRKDGVPIPVELSIQLLDYQKEKAMLIISRDITERKKAQEAVLQAKFAAEAASKTKSEFIANMSHELRTPLNSIIGFSDVIYNESHGALNESQKKYASNILRNGKNLLNVINNIISISNIDNRKMELHINEFFVSDTIDEVEALMMPIASQKDIDLTCNIDIEAPTIKADAIKFKQILYNLVSNAIKFTDQGGSVTIGGEISEHIVHIYVKDNGIGISPENQDKLFNPFFQTDSSTTREFGGTGLGLALVKKFIEMHDGQIWVESEVGKGSTFTFRIPTHFESTSF